MQLISVLSILQILLYRIISLLQIYCMLIKKFEKSAIDIYNFIQPSLASVQKAFSSSSSSSSTARRRVEKQIYRKLEGKKDYF